MFAAADADSAATFSYPLAEGAADFARYQRQLADKAEQVKTARGGGGVGGCGFRDVPKAAEELRDRRRGSRAAARLVVSVVDRVVRGEYGDDPLYSLALNVAVFSLGAENAFFFPFGFTPIKNFIANSGFFIVAGWLFLC